MRLSKLQKWILQYAADHSHHKGTWCYIADVIQGYYGITSNNKYSFENEDPHPGEQNFRDHSESEYKKIRAARSAISRAFVTLMKKGLVTIVPIENSRSTGILITDKGKLTVNIDGQLDSSVNSYDTDTLRRLEEIILRNR